MLLREVARRWIGFSEDDVRAGAVFASNYLVAVEALAGEGLHRLLCHAALANIDVQTLLRLGHQVDDIRVPRKQE